MGHWEPLCTGAFGLCPCVGIVNSESELRGRVGVSVYVKFCSDQIKLLNIRNESRDVVPPASS